MIFAGPCSPRFTADTLVVSLNVGEGGPGEALRFPCAFVAIVNGRRGRGLGIAERGFGLVAAESEGEGEGFDGCSRSLCNSLRAASSVLALRATLSYEYGHRLRIP
jgi:hypothetical protein